MRIATAIVTTSALLIGFRNDLVTLFSSSPKSTLEIEADGLTVHNLLAHQPTFYLHTNVGAHQASVMWQVKFSIENASPDPVELDDIVPQLGPTTVGGHVYRLVRTDSSDYFVIYKNENDLDNVDSLDGSAQTDAELERQALRPLLIPSGTTAYFAYTQSFDLDIDGHTVQFQDTDDSRFAALVAPMFGLQQVTIDGQNHFRCAYSRVPTILATRDGNFAGSIEYAINVADCVQELNLNDMQRIIQQMENGDILHPQSTGP